MSPTPEVRTRIAPSPTGDPHIGTAYMALFDYALAKSLGGKFVLRIEDTDQTRSTRESEEAILASLRWIGLQWDEGPDVGGPAGPYRQSERTEIYREYCQILLDRGHAYRCFCTAERLEEMRKSQQGTAKLGYDGHCAALCPAEVDAHLAAGVPYVVRMRVPKEGECVLHDVLRGDVTTPWATVDDQVLMKSDHFPTYHLANVVDDHLMGITHVIRGEEWLSSGPKHQLLYQYFGWEPPQFIHMPLLRNPDKSKLSKRKNPTSIEYYRRAGYLPEALLNYLGLMGYAPPDGSEVFSLQDFVATFDIGRVSLGGPIFDPAKLTWLNGRYLREKTSPEQLLERLQGWLLNDATWSRILPLAQKRIEKLSDLVPMAAFFFADRVTYEPSALVAGKLDGPQVARLLRLAVWEMEKMRRWDKDLLHERLAALAEKEGLKLRDATLPFYVALTGAAASTPLFESMEILGSDMTRRRLMVALEALETLGHGFSSKKLKELQEYYAANY